MSTPLMPVKRRGRPPGYFARGMHTPQERQHVAVRLPYDEALAVAGVGYVDGVRERITGAVRGYAGMYWDPERTTLTLLFRVAEDPGVAEGGELAWLKGLVG